MGRTYAARTRPRRIYVDANKNIVRPPWEGGGAISTIDELVRPPSDEDAAKTRKIELKEVETSTIDDETKAALEVLKQKGLL